MAQDLSTTSVVDDVVAARPRTQGPPPFFPEPPDDHGDGGRPGDDDDRHGPPISNAWLGMLMFLGAETMFFAGLVGSFLVYRLSTTVWPPAAMPRLPVGVTGLNTLILLYSAYTMWRAHRLLRAGHQGQFAQVLLLTGLLGTVFLAVQGYEWVQLIGFGLTLSSGVYGATFYTLIGCHALHVFGAVLWLFVVWLRARRQQYTATRRTGVMLCSMYWYYVVGLWPILYWLVYLF